MAEQLKPESLVARIIAELQANPEAQRMLLRAMLTNEFLGMPARLDRIEKDIAELKKDVTDLRAKVTKLQADVTVLQADVTVLKTDVAGLKTDVAGLKTDVGYLKGSDLEMKVHRRIQPLLSQLLELRRVRIIQSGVHQCPEDFADRVAAAADEGRISEAQEHRIIATDIILRGRRRRERTPVWVAVEVANRIDADDIVRSRNSADTLAAVFGEEAVPLIAGYRIDAADRERAADAGVRYLEVPERL